MDAPPEVEVALNGGPLKVDVRGWPGVLLERYSYLAGPPSDYPAHVHDTYQLGIALGRAGEYRFRGVTEPVPTLGIVTIHPGEPHSVRDVAPRDEPRTYLMMYIDPARVGELMEEMSGRRTSEPFIRRPAFDRDIVSAYTSLFSADLDTELERESRLVGILGALVRHHADETQRDRDGLRSTPMLNGVRDMLHEQTVAPSLSELAQFAGVSRYHLVRQFTAHFGVPPHTYHLQRRLDDAKRLLAEGVPASRVALRTGFYDQSHFGRHFRRLVGVSPGRYRPPETGTSRRQQ